MRQVRLPYTIRPCVMSLSHLLLSRSNLIGLRILELEGCKLQKAISILLGEKEGRAVPEHDYSKLKDVKEFIKINALEPLSHPLLIDYITSRAISRLTASKWLVQLSISFPYSKSDPNKQHLVVGFKNDSGGYEMRNKYLKVSNSPKNIRTIRGIKSGVVLFEGFFNYLSYLEIEETLTELRTVIVLNSASFLGSIIPILKGKTVYSFLDADDTGDKYTKLMVDEGIDVIDQRKKYLRYNDLNEYLIKIMTL